jgi:hypothetical protein
MAGKVIDLTGKRFNRLIATELVKVTKDGAYWNFKCDCGNEKVLPAHSAKRGYAKSCGCMKKEKEVQVMGKRFGRLIGIKRLHSSSEGIVWEFKCDCGNSLSLAAKSVSSGHTQSCGCLQKERTSEAGYKHGMTNERIYGIWAGMVKRCFNKNNHAFKHYGGRGIRVQDSWKDFVSFKNDMYKSYLKHVAEFSEKQTTIERIDVNGGYNVKNCKWATTKEQSLNRRNNFRIVYGKDNLTISEWSTRLGLSPGTITGRIKNLNWPIELALSLRKCSRKNKIYQTIKK